VYFYSLSDYSPLYLPLHVSLPLLTQSISPTFHLILAGEFVQRGRNILIHQFVYDSVGTLPPSPSLDFTIHLASRRIIPLRAADTLASVDFPSGNKGRAVTAVHVTSASYPAITPTKANPHSSEHPLAGAAPAHAVHRSRG